MTAYVTANDSVHFDLILVYNPLKIPIYQIL